MSYASEQAVLNMQWNAANTAELVELERKRPFMLLHPRMIMDGNQWCALYGDNIHDGVCGFGETPEKAAQDFDLAWLNCKPPQADEILVRQQTIQWHQHTAALIRSLITEVERLRKDSEALMYILHESGPERECYSFTGDLCKGLKRIEYRIDERDCPPHLKDLIEKAHERTDKT